MNLIDHRILIPASPEHVWRFVGDLYRNVEWHVNAKNLSILTSLAKPGAGTRFRLSQQRGRDQVWEVTAWYDRFGYEYHIVEGSPFRQNKGLFRLQETPEGTVVQWTLNYSGGGLFGGGGKAQEQIIIESLQKLYKLITRSKEVDTFQAKSLMRDDPGVEARANYRPRHSTSVPTESGEGVRVPKSPYAPPTPSKPIPAVPIDNPFATPAAFNPLPAPRKLEETRPRPTVVEPVSNPTSLEPDFLIDEPNTPFSEIPSEPLRVPPVMPVFNAPQPIQDDMPVFAPPVFRPPPSVENAPSVNKPMIPPDFLDDAPPARLPMPTPPPMPPVVIAPPPVFAPPSLVISPPPVAPQPPSVEAESTPIAPEPVIPIDPPVAPKAPARDKLSDTSKLSVFEIFGLLKPSETQPMAPLNMEALSATGRITPLMSEILSEVEPQPINSPLLESPLTLPVQPVSPARTVGKRALLRRKLGNVRSRFEP